MKKRNVSIDQTRKLARLMSFELSWWAERDWLSARTFSELASRPLPDGFDIEQRLLG